MYDPHHRDGKQVRYPNSTKRNWVIVGIGAAIFLVGMAIATYGRAADIGSMKDMDSRDRPFLVAPAKAAPGVATSWTSVWAAALASYNMSNSGLGGEGWSGDVQLGADVQLGRFVVGAFGEYSFGGTESEVRVFDGLARLNVEQQDSYSILARAGVVTSDGNTLLYVASGYTWTTVEATLRAGEDSVSRDYDFGGIPLELGVEHKFGPNVRGRLSGRYTWFGQETVFKDEDEGYGSRLTAEPGVLSIKAGVVISTSGGSLNPLN